MADLGGGQHVRPEERIAALQKRIEGLEMKRQQAREDANIEYERFLECSKEVGRLNDLLDYSRSQHQAWCKKWGRTIHEVERLREVEKTARPLRDLLQEDKAYPGEFQEKLAALDNALIVYDRAALQTNDVCCSNCGKPILGDACSMSHAVLKAERRAAFYQKDDSDTEGKVEDLGK